MIAVSAFDQWLTPLLRDKVDPNVLVAPGPDDPDIPWAYVLITRTGGAGFAVDGRTDQVSYQFKSVGEQNNYDQAERMALSLDKIVLGDGSSFYMPITNLYLISVNRVGGGPSALMVDDGDRTHFVCDYQFEVESGY